MSRIKLQLWIGDDHLPWEQGRGGGLIGSVWMNEVGGGRGNVFEQRVQVDRERRRRRRTGGDRLDVQSQQPARKTSAGNESRWTAGVAGSAPVSGSKIGEPVSRWFTNP